MLIILLRCLNEMKLKMKNLSFGIYDIIRRIHKGKDDKRSENEGSRSKQYLAAAGACITMAACGACQAWSSPAIPHLTSNRSSFPVTDSQAVWIVSLYTLGDMFGVLLNLLFINRYGRRYTILFFSLTILLGWFLIIFAENVTYLYTARFIAGIGQGSTYNSLVIYLTEISEKSIRGALVNMMQISVALGLFTFTSIAAFTSYEFLNISSASLLILFLVIFPFLPETPYYYLLRERNDDAMICLMKLRGLTSPDKLEAEMREMKLAIDEDRKNTRNFVFFELISKSYNRKGLAIMICMKLSQSFTGVVAIASYAEDIFSQNRLPFKAGIQVMIFNGVSLLASLCTNLFIDRVNRRFLFLSSGVLCAICLASIGLFFVMKNYLNSDVSSVAWIPLVVLCLFHVSYALGISIIPYIILGELFSIKVKSSAVCCGNIIGDICDFTTASGFKPLSNAFGVYTNFWIFALVTFVGSLLSFWISPDTSRMTLEEIQAMQNPQLGVKLEFERRTDLYANTCKKT